jgi:hypothetical protein
MTVGPIPVNLEQFGRKVAESTGDPIPDGLDFAAYGAACRDALKSRKGPPEMAGYVMSSSAEQPAARNTESPSNRGKGMRDGEALTGGVAAPGYSPPLRVLKGKPSPPVKAPTHTHRGWALWRALGAVATALCILLTNTLNVAAQALLWAAEQVAGTAEWIRTERELHKQERHPNG